MKSTPFKGHVQNKTVKTPSEKGFDRKKWDVLWEQHKSDNPMEIGLYEAGHIFDKIFSSIRSELAALYSRAPVVTREKLLQIYCGSCNRNGHIVVNSNLVEEDSPNFLPSITTSNTSSGNAVTLVEAAETSVDAIQKAVTNLVRATTKIETCDNALSVMEFVEKELELSHRYDLYESYWMALVWGDYQFSQMLDEPNCFEVIQNRSEFEESKCLSLARKQKLHTHQTMLIKTNGLYKHISKGAYIDIKGTGKNKTLVVKDISGAHDLLKLRNVAFQMEIDELSEWFSPELVKSIRTRIGFSITEALTVFKALMLFSYSYTARFPDKTNIVNVNQYFEYSPKIKFIDLISAVTSATQLSREKCFKILEYLSFTGTGGQDIWCHPLIKINGRDVILVAMPAASPMIHRLVENWLLYLNVEMSAKGAAYEALVFQKLKNEMADNKMFEDCRIVCSTVFGAPNGERSEEIDLIIKMGNLVIIGESKFMVTTDSPISAFRARDTLKRASQQAKRKTIFFKDNIELFFSQLGWGPIKVEDIRFCPIIIDGARALTGYVSDDVPVCDEIIISKFFETNVIPLISDLNKDKHLAWFHLYSDFRDAPNVFEKYIRNPPQLARPIHHTQYLEGRIPSQNASIPEIIYKRLAPAGVDMTNLEGYETPFPIEKSEDFYEEIEKMKLFA